MFINVLINSFVLVFLLDEVHSQVCVTQVFVTKMVQEMFTYSYLVSYSSPNLHSRWETNTMQKYVPKRWLKDVKKCCTGYRKVDDDMEVSEKTCKPVCTSACTNGYCKYPEECACHSGYTKRNDICEPLCKEGCLHGTCVAPETCRCDPGYEFVNETCQPVCTKPCYNWSCLTQEICECLPGYRRSDKDVCEPYCSNGCYHGYCKAPESCGCNAGWRLAKNESDGESNMCVPVCEAPCGNGTCDYPNTCSCFSGYYIDFIRQWGYRRGVVCRPICVDCGGTCIAPNECVEDNSTTKYEYTTSTSVRHPFRTTSSYTYFNGTESYNTFEKNVVSNYSLRSAVDDQAKSNVTIGESMAKSWMQQYGMFILIPIIVVVIAGIIMLLVWRRTPITIIHFFRGRRYNVRDARPYYNRSYTFENVQFLPNDGGAQN